MKIDELVDKYVRLRDKKDEMKLAYNEKVAVVDEALVKIEGVLLKHFQATGQESAKTPFGTAYTSTRTSATVADWDIYLQFVREHEMWEMLEKRANKTAVEQYRDAHEDLPPGVNWREELVVNIRRTSK